MRVIWSPRFLVGNGGVDPYDSLLRSPIVVPKTHSSIPYEEPVSRAETCRGSGLGALIGLSFSGFLFRDAFSRAPF